MSNGSIFIAKSIHNYKKYNDQSADIFNNSKWNPVIQENIVHWRDGVGRQREIVKPKFMSYDRSPERANDFDMRP